MTTILKIVFVALIVFIMSNLNCSCSPTKRNTKDIQHGTYTVNWSDGVTIYTVLIQFEDEVLGRGKIAYDVLVKKLGGVPRGSTIIFRAPADIVQLIEEHTNESPASPLPFRDEVEAKEKFADICIQNQLKYKLDTYITGNP